MALESIRDDMAHAPKPRPAGFRGGRARRWLALLLGTVVTALASAGPAAADKEKIHLTPAGNAAARAAVVRLADLGAGTGWTGGRKKPKLNSSLQCASYQPKQSDLVLVGAAESSWTSTGLIIDSQASVLRTAKMVRLDWQRSVVAPQVLPCLRAAVVKELGASGTLVSLRRVAFPKLARFVRKFRARIDVPNGTTTVSVMLDVVMIGSGRTEMILTATAPASASASVGAAELHLARVLVSRVRA